ncbi:MAG: hypothetical protein MMC33_005016 [Icmadophila ericetorum]|nr:hypothetical protein [Icmadophila ericetorum]
MAPARSRLPVPIGSRKWVDTEREQFSAFQAEELETFALAASGQLEHLNAKVKQCMTHTRSNTWHKMLQTPKRLGLRTPGLFNKTAKRDSLSTSFQPRLGAPRTSSISRGFRLGLTTELHNKFFGDIHGATTDPMEVDEKANPASLPQEMEMDPEPTVHENSEPTLLDSQDERKDVQQPTVPLAVPTAYLQQSSQHDDVLLNENLAPAVSSKNEEDKLTDEQLMGPSYDGEKLVELEATVSSNMQEDKSSNQAIPIPSTIHEVPSEHQFPTSSNIQEDKSVEHDMPVSSNTQKDKSTGYQFPVSSKPQEDKPGEHDLLVFSKPQEDKPAETNLAVPSNVEKINLTEHMLSIPSHYQGDNPDGDRSLASSVSGKDKSNEQASPISLDNRENQLDEYNLPSTSNNGDDHIMTDEEPEVNSAHSPSFGSSPVKQLIRKSSLTFASLPAREPLTTKKSMGARVSRTSHLDQGKTPGNAYLGAYVGGILSGDTHQEDDMEMIDVDGLVRPKSTMDESDHEMGLATLHNKSSTQRLHDRINLLGKNQPTRPTKSIPLSISALLQANHPDQRNADNVHVAEAECVKSANEKAVIQEDDDDDDWIAPPPQKPKDESRASIFESRAVGVTDAAEKSKDGKDVGHQIPVEASKSKLQLAIASARSVLTSSATVTKSTTASSSVGAINTTTASKAPVAPKSAVGRQSPVDDNSTDTSILNKGDYFVYTHNGEEYARRVSHKTIVRPESLTRRGSDPLREEWRRRGFWMPFEIWLEEYLHPGETYKKKMAAMEQAQKDAEAAEAARKKEMAAAKERNRARSRESLERKHAAIAAVRNGGTKKEVKEPAKPSRQSPRLHPAQQANPSADTADPALVEPKPQVSLIKQLKQIQRPTKATKDAGPKPKPVSIQVNTLSQHLPTKAAPHAPSTTKPLPTPTAKQLATGPKSNTFSGQSSSTSASSKTSASSTIGKPRALLAAERKKEQEEKEALRKQEAKRENERKRAIQLEETQKRERQKRQETEKKRIDLQKKEQIRTQQKSATENTFPPTQPEKSQSQAHPHRAELGGGRQPSRLMQEFPKPPNHYMVNPAKPPVKRPLQTEPEPDPEKEDQGILAYDETESKRRKTTELRPTMAPPMRQSNALKHGSKPSANNPNNRSSLLKASTVHNTYQQHPAYDQARVGYPAEMAKYISNSRIPFAEAPNPPNNYTYKTPLPSKQPMANADYTSPSSNGENITLVDIKSDSDSEDSDEEKKRKNARPEWASTPELAGHLLAQDHELNPDAVFGRIVTPRLEKMFPERPSHFRARSSSANWAGADRLTFEEIQMDEEARERLRIEGEWKFHAS